MIYTDPIVTARFLHRPNRFLAYVWMEGREEAVHVKNTGRMKELLVPGAVLYLEDRSRYPGRNTRYSVIAAEKNSMLVNLDSQAPNAVAAEALEQGLWPFYPQVTSVKREVTYGRSRFDLAVTGRDHEGRERKALIEIKGVTLEKEGIAAFPDAPTTRGRRHVLELADAASSGYDAAVMFLLQMTGPRRFVPHWDRDPAFAEALLTARAAGVRILAYDARVTYNSMKLGHPIPVQLERAAAVELLKP